MYLGTKPESVVIAITVVVFEEAMLSYKTFASDTGVPKDLFSGEKGRKFPLLPDVWIGGDTISFVFSNVL